MKTRNLSLFGKIVVSGAVKAVIAAILSVVFVAILMTVASNFVYSASNDNGIPTSFANRYDNCPFILDDDKFKVKYDEIASKYFDETKMNLSRELLEYYCLSSAQVNDLMKLFSYDRNRIEFANVAIYKVADPDNFGICKEAFVIRANGNVIDGLMKEYSVSLSK